MTQGPINYQTPPPPVGGSDSEMGPLDWVLCILCGCIGLIVGIVYLTQGKPKGKMMIIVSVAAIIVWNVISFIGRSALHH